MSWAPEILNDHWKARIAAIPISPTYDWVWFDTTFGLQPLCTAQYYRVFHLFYAATFPHDAGVP